MKTRLHLLMLMLVLVLVVVCIAACGGTQDPAETTAATTTAPTTTAPATTAPTTTADPAVTTAPTTTADPAVTTAPPVTGAPVANIHPHAQGIEVFITGGSYTGKGLNAGYGVTNLGYKVFASWSFQQIDPATGLALPGVAPVAQPVEVGTYNATVTFAFHPQATADDKTYDLPEPVSGRYVVSKIEITTNTMDLIGAQDVKAYWYEEMQLELGDPADPEDGTSPVARGALPAYLERVYKVYTVDDATGANPVALNSTVVTDPGFYKVVITYREPAGFDNVVNEATFSHEAIVEVERVDDRYRVLKANGIEIDGVIDPAYYASAKMTSASESWHEKNASATPDVNYKENIGMVEIHKGNKDMARPNTSVTLYTLWGEEEVTVGGSTETWPFLYVALEVHDENILPRSTAYTAHRDAWINDSVEFTYKLGGFDVPVIPAGQDTYPTYSTVLVDAREKTVADHAIAPNHSAVDAQKSVFFDYIQSATKHVGENTYVIEIKIPARAETHEGTLGTSSWKRHEGAALGAGEFVFLCLQLNDLTGLPDGYESIGQYDANIPSGDKYPNDLALVPTDPAWIKFENDLSPFMYCSGNRRAAYLRKEGNGPIIFQLSNLTYNVDITLDGEKEDDYAKGEKVTEAKGEYETILFEGNRYIYTTVTSGATGVVTYIVGNNELIFTVDNAGNKAEVTGDITRVQVEKAETGYAHEVKIDMTGIAGTGITVTLP